MLLWLDLNLKKKLLKCVACNSLRLHSTMVSFHMKICPKFPIPKRKKNKLIYLCFNSLISVFLLTYIITLHQYNAVSKIEWRTRISLGLCLRTNCGTVLWLLREMLAYANRMRSFSSNLQVERKRKSIMAAA